MDTTAQPERVNGYASALIDVARAEGDAEVFVETFYSVAKTITGNQELRDTLTDPQIPVDRKQGIVSDLLGVRVDGVVVASVNFLVAAGQAKHLDEIASRLAELVAEEEGSVVAEVQSAVALDADQVARLEAALSKATGKRVQAKVVTDSSLMGGLVAKIGDTVFDGSVKSRLDDVREQWG
ncbi:MAG: ATP synthase F1 subunit delta [Actinomycetota bacterium]